jgi:hypothetical protein
MATLQSNHQETIAVQQNYSASQELRRESARSFRDLHVRTHKHMCNSRIVGTYSNDSPTHRRTIPVKAPYNDNEPKSLLLPYGKNAPCPKNVNSNAINNGSPRATATHFIMCHHSESVRQSVVSARLAVWYQDTCGWNSNDTHPYSHYLRQQ